MPFRGLSCQDACELPRHGVASDRHSTKRVCRCHFWHDDHLVHSVSHDLDDEDVDSDEDEHSSGDAAIQGSVGADAGEDHNSDHVSVVV